MMMMETKRLTTSGSRGEAQKIHIYVFVCTFQYFIIHCFCRKLFHDGKQFSVRFHFMNNRFARVHAFWTSWRKSTRRSSIDWLHFGWRTWIIFRTAFVFYFVSVKCLFTSKYSVKLIRLPPAKRVDYHCGHRLKMAKIKLIFQQNTRSNASDINL